MEEEEGGIRLSKRVSEKGGEVDYKDKAGTAWSHSYLNQKPWHPLSYPNQRRKWIAEQTHAQRERRAEEVAREFSQEQEFFRQTALISKKEKEKVEMMKAVSFMYVRPPGYNAESAKAAEIADERRRLEHDSPSHVGPSTEMPPEYVAGRNHPGEERKKPRPKDVFGRPLPTEEEFEVLKNAPRLETGVPARVKPFGVEVRNVKCVRCGNFGHQSGDRECPLKDAIMPNEESRLKRDDPLTAILAHTDASEPLKWELKQKPGISPPRGGFKPDDPNQQIVSEDIFDEYGGFLSGENIIPGLLTNFSSSNLPKKRKSSRKGKHKRLSSPISSQSKDHPPVVEAERRSRNDNKHRKKTRDHSESSCSSDDDSEDYGGRRSKRDNKYRKKKKKRVDCESSLSDNSEDDMAGRRSKKEDNMYKNKKKNKKRTQNHSEFGSSSDNEKRRLKKDDKYRKRRNHPKSSSSDDNPERSNKGSNYRKKRSDSDSSSSDNSEFDRHHLHKKSRNKRTIDRRNSSENIDPDKHYRSKHQRHHH